MSTISSPAPSLFSSSSLGQSQVTELLETLYADATEKDARPVHGASGLRGNEQDHYQAARHRYMAVGREFGRLLYTLARSIQAETIVEFGTSFGVSTIYLASALRDQGKGKLVTTELIAEKSAQAEKNLVAAGLAEWVEFRVGDVRETLQAPAPEEIDLLFLDGAKSLYLPVLNLLESRLRPGALLVSDNTNQAGVALFLDYVRKPGNGYVSSALLTAQGERSQHHEITIRL